MRGGMGFTLGAARRLIAIVTGTLLAMAVTGHGGGGSLRADEQESPTPAEKPCVPTLAEGREKSIVVATSKLISDQPSQRTGSGQSSEGDLKPIARVSDREPASLELRRIAALLEYR